MKSALLAAAVTLTLTVTASAQTATAWVELEDRVAVEALGQSVDQVEDMNVVNGAGQKIGEVEEVVGPDANTAAALVVDFDDSAGYGDNDLLVPLANLAMGNGALTLGIEPASAASLQRWDD